MGVVPNLCVALLLLPAIGWELQASTKTFSPQAATFTHTNDTQNFTVGEKTLRPFPLPSQGDK